MVKLNAQVGVLDQDIEVGLSSSIIYAFSPIAKVQELPNGYFLITITDKNGTTTAIIPVVSEENIAEVVNQYFEQNPIIQDYIHQHNISDQAHEDIRQLITQVATNIPTRVSQLENDEKYIKNFKELLKFYPSYYSFPNIPTQDQKDMIFVDQSNNDMYVFGLNDTLAYSSIGIANKETIFGGESEE